MSIGHDDRDGHDQQGDDREEGADPEHHEQDADHREEGGDQLGQALLERLGDVVDVVGDAAQDVAARLAVEVGEREAAELHVDAPAEPVDRPLGDAGHDVALGPAEDRAGDDRPRSRAGGSLRGPRSRCPGRARRPCSRACRPGCPCRPPGAPRRPASFDMPGGIWPPIQPSKMTSVALPRILGPTIAKPTLTIAKSHDDHHEEPLGCQLAEEPPEGGAEVARLRRGHRGEPHRPAPTRAAGTTARAAAARLPLRGPCPARSRHLLLGELRRDDLAVGRRRSP